MDNSWPSMVRGLDLLTDLPDEVEDDVVFHVGLEVLPGEEVEVLYLTLLAALGNIRQHWLN